MACRRKTIKHLTSPGRESSPRPSGLQLNNYSPTLYQLDHQGFLFRFVVGDLLLGYIIFQSVGLKVKVCESNDLLGELKLKVRESRGSEAIFLLRHLLILGFNLARFSFRIHYFLYSNFNHKDGALIAPSY